MTQSIAQKYGVRAFLTETQRVLGLPAREQDSTDCTAKYIREGSPVRLRAVQSAALNAAAEVIERGAAAGEPLGVLGSIGVGEGKTYIDLLLGAAFGAELLIVLVPAAGVQQMHVMLEGLRPHAPGLPKRIEIVSYGKLSTTPKDGEQALLEQLIVGVPDHKVVVVADEVHYLKRLASARTKRVVRFLQEHMSIRFCALSGTLGGTTLAESAHIAEMVLRSTSPIPRDRHHLNAWGACLDINGMPTADDWNVVGALGRAVYPDFDQHRPKDKRPLLRKAFFERFRLTPGVVTTPDNELGIPLFIEEHTLEVPERVLDYYAMTEAGMAPDGSELPDPIAISRVQRQLSCGFYYTWVWPNGVRDDEWLEARNKWNRYVRHELEHRAEEGYDSPLLVFRRVRRDLEAGRYNGIHQAFEAWLEQKHKPAPPVEPVWISDFHVQDAVRWLRRQKLPSILWYTSTALEQALAAAGVPVFGAGSTPPAEAIPCAMSIRVHGVVKNLQDRWSLQRVLEVSPNEDVWEQMLGRLHRSGQQADGVHCLVDLHTPRLLKSFAEAVERARHAEDKRGIRQKLLYANYTFHTEGVREIVFPPCANNGDYVGCSSASGSTVGFGDGSEV